MSARMISGVPSSRLEHGAMVDQRGYAYCLDCYEERERPEAEWTEAASVCGDCDGCGKPLEKCTPLKIEGTATIEYPACKIF